MTTGFTRVIVAATLLSTGGPAIILGAAPGQKTPPLVQASLVSAERNDIGQLSTALSQFLTAADALDKRGNASRSELDALTTNANHVKQATLTYQRAMQSALAKLQASGRWTPDLDRFVEDRLSAANATNTLNYVRLHGGARAAFQASLTNITSLGPSLDGDLRHLRGSGLSTRALEALIGTPVEASLSSWVHLCASRYADGVLCIVSDSACGRAAVEESEGACQIR
jgi:hypothetical protein